MRTTLVLWAMVTGVHGGALMAATGPCADTVAKWSTLTVGPPRIQVFCETGAAAASTFVTVQETGKLGLDLFSTDLNYTAALQAAVGTTEATAAAKLSSLGVNHTLCIDDTCIIAPELACGPALVDGFRVCTPEAPDINPPCFAGAHATCSELITAAFSVAGGVMMGWLSVLVAPPKA